MFALNRCIAVVGIVFAIATTGQAQNYSNYGRVNPTPDGMIDLAINQKVLAETDYQSAYTGLIVQRWKHLTTGKWRWKFDSMIGYLPDDSRPGITQQAEDFMTLQLPERQLILYEDQAKNRANGIFETFKKGTPDSEGRFVIQVTNPGTDAVTTYSPHKSIFVANDGNVYTGDVPDTFKKRYFYYRIVSEQFRDGTIIRYDWNNNNDCSDVTVRHQPSNTAYVVSRSAFAHIPPEVTTQPRAGWDYCRVDAITLPNSMKLVYSYADRVPADWAPGQSAYVRLNKVSVAAPGDAGPTVLRRYEHRSDTFERDNPGKYMAVSKIINADGRVVQRFTFDASGRPNTSSTGGKNPIWITYNADGSRTVTDGDSVARNFFYQKIAGVRRLVGISQPCSWCAVPHNTIEYDAATGLVSKTTDFAGVATTYSRFPADPRRRVKRVVEAAGTPDARTTDSEWHPVFNLPTKVVVTQGKQSYTKAYAYDGWGRETVRRFDQTTNGTAISRTTTTTYVNHPSSPIAKTITVREPRDDTMVESVSSFDVAGRLRSKTNALGHTTSYGDYDVHGRPRSITYPNGLTASLRYDWRGKLLSRTYDGVTTSNEYSAGGQLLKSTATLGDGTVASSETYTYDAGGRVTSVTDAMGNRIDSEYDQMSRRLSHVVRDPSTNINLVSEGYLYGYDDGGRTITSRPVLVPTFTQTKLNNRYLVKSVSEPYRLSVEEARKTTMGYDNLGRLSDKVTSAGVVQAIDYDVADQVTQSTYWASGSAAVDGETRRDFLYTTDAEGNPLARSDPDSGAETYLLTPAGSVRSSSNAGNGPRWQFSYDALRRPVRRSIVDAAGHELGYVAATYDTVPGDVNVASAPGKLTGLTGTFGDIDYRYSKAGRVTMRITRKPGGTSADTHTQLFYYDGFGRQLSTRYPSGRWVWTALDGLGRTAEISTAAAQGVAGTYVATGIQYYAAGTEIRSLQLGGNQSAQYTRDSMRRLTGYAFAGRSYALSYELDGKLKSVDKTYSKPVFVTCPAPVPGRPGLPQNNCTPGWATQEVKERQQEYVYDAASRHLTSAATSGTLRAYVHDAYGNLLSGPSGSFATKPKSNQVARFQYNYGGRVTNDGVNQIDYDVRGYISRIVNAGGTTTYTYNAEGQRATKTRNGYTIYFHYDANGNLIGERDSLGVWLREYVWLGARPLMMIVPATATSPEARYSVHVDHSLAPVALTDVSGKLVWEWERGPYGEGQAVSSVSGLTMNLRMPGQYFDAESGYFYNRTRYFDPRSGRFLQPDPAGEAGSGPSLYAYTHGDPVNFVDPSGNLPLAAWFVRALQGAFIGGLSGYISSEGDFRVTAAGVASGFLTGGLSPFGGQTQALFPGASVGVIANAGLSNIGAQLMNDWSGLDTYKTAASLAGQSLVLNALSGGNAWALAGLRGSASGVAQWGYNKTTQLFLRQPAGPDASSFDASPVQYGMAPFGVSALHDWGYESRFGGSPLMMTYLNPADFYGAAHENVADVVGWPTGTDEEKLAVDISVIITPDNCTFCN
ncbi:MAG: RHS repeat-associated core domain-containing protein [Burkholderiales bacterium]|nr:RHS repeat-associated core domain-containing protein [Burkholderiales bacterium]